MIFYFSGTGNSQFLAENIAQTHQQELFSISDLIKKNQYDFRLKEDEMIGFVFPIHSWGVPSLVLDSIKQLSFANYRQNYLFFVCSVGDDCALAEKLFQKAITQKKWTCHSGFSVIMPNNYILMDIKLFDIDSEEIQQKKMIEAKLRLLEINRQISQRKTNYFDCVKTNYSWVKSRIIYPIFNFGLKYATKKFHATTACTGCGLCEELCPVSSIKVDGKPIWSKKCTQCLACIHHCPTRAIQYSDFTEKKGRYVCSLD